MPLTKTPFELLMKLIEKRDELNRAGSSAARRDLHFHLELVVDASLIDAHPEEPMDGEQGSFEELSPRQQGGGEVNSVRAALRRNRRQHGPSLPSMGVPEAKDHGTIVTAKGAPS